MKGKAKQKKRIGKAILIGMGFFLTIVLTFTTTLAWFYDSDWANKYINMAGTVGIEIRRKEQDGDPEGVNLRTSGTGNLYFHLYQYDPTETPKGYPGQAINVSASVYNNGGKSGSGGSKCFVRAHFAVYTNIGKLPDVNDYDDGADSAAYKARKAEILADAGLSESTDEEAIAAALEAAGLDADDYAYTNEGATEPLAFTEAKNEAQKESSMNASALYTFLNNLILEQNKLNSAVSGSTPTGYEWVYYKHKGALPLSQTGTLTSDVEYYLEGKKYKDNDQGKTGVDVTEVEDVTKVEDKGYFYLCTDSVSGQLKELGVTDSAVFLWNNTFIIPWQLTNTSADKIIFIGLTFQAIQTFIPQMNADGTISGAADNKLPLSGCTYSATAVQTVFNSCNFAEMETTININGEPVDFTNRDLYDSATKPTPAAS